MLRKKEKTNSVHFDDRNIESIMRNGKKKTSNKETKELNNGKEGKEVKSTFNRRNRTSITVTTKVFQSKTMLENFNLTQGFEVEKVKDNYQLTQHNRPEKRRKTEIILNLPFNPDLSKQETNELLNQILFNSPNKLKRLASMTQRESISIHSNFDGTNNIHILKKTPALMPNTTTNTTTNTVIINKKPKNKPVHINNPYNEKHSYHTYLYQKIPDDSLKFTDFNFPISYGSINSGNNDEFPINSDSIYWLRLNAIFPEFMIISKSMKQPKYPSQGCLKDSNVLTALIAMSYHMPLIEKIFITNTPQALGCYQLILRINKEPTVVLIDDYFPCFKATKCPIFARSTPKNLWPMLIEKALAKVAGSYSNLQKMSIEEILEMTLRFPVMTRNIPIITKTTKDKIYNDIKEALTKAQNKVTIAKMKQSPDESISTNKNRIGLEYDCYYVIKGIFEEKIDGEKHCLIKMKLPITKQKAMIKQYTAITDRKTTLDLAMYSKPGINAYDFTGEWQYSSEKWNSDTKTIFLEYHNEDEEDGFVWLTYDEFILYFKSITLFHFIAPFYNSYVELPKSNLLVYSMQLIKNTTVHLTIASKSPDSIIEIVLLRIKDSSASTHKKLIEVNCFDIINTSINNLSYSNSLPGTFLILLYISDTLEDVGMNISSTAKISLKEVQANEKSKELLIQKIGCTINLLPKSQYRDKHKSIRTRNEKGLIMTYPLRLPHTNIYFIIFNNSNEKDVNATIDWNLTNCSLILPCYQNKNDVMKLRPNEIISLPIIGFNHENDEKTHHEEMVIDLSVKVSVSKIKTVLFSDITGGSYNDDYAIFNQCGKLDNESYEYVISDI